MHDPAKPRTRFGEWAGNPNGVPADPALCNEGVYPQGQWFEAQCSRKRGYGPGGLYCKQHAKWYLARPAGPTEGT